MNFQKVKSIFKKKRNWFKEYPEIRIIHAFTSGGVDYYEFEDPNLITEGRGFAALDFYKELSMNCTRAYLESHAELMNEYLRPKPGKSIDIPEMVKLNIQLSERLQMIIDSVTPYKVASVIYFDETEDPFSFDFKYAMEVKIPRWKKEKVSSFFLRAPLQNLIPPTLLSEENLENYMTVAREMDKMHYQNISDAITGLSSTNPRMTDLLNRLKLEKNLI